MPHKRQRQRANFRSVELENMWIWLIINIYFWSPSFRLCLNTRRRWHSNRIASRNRYTRQRHNGCSMHSMYAKRRIISLVNALICTCATMKAMDVRVILTWTRAVPCRYLWLRFRWITIPIIWPNRIAHTGPSTRRRRWRLRCGLKNR